MMTWEDWEDGANGALCDLCLSCRHFDIEEGACTMGVVNVPPDGECGFYE